MSLFGIPFVEGLIFVALSVLLYLIIDISTVAPGPIQTMFLVLEFWVLWLILCVLTLLSYGVLKTTAGTKISNAFGADLATLATIVLAVLSSLTVIQSFSLKIADTKILDVQKILEKFRVVVLAKISRENAQSEARKRMRLADKLNAVFENDVQALREEYAEVLTNSGLEQAKILTSLTDCQRDAAAASLYFSRQLARRITQVNPDRAKDLIEDANSRRK